MVEFGPIGKEVFERTYSRKLPDGTSETFPQTISRVVQGNCGFVAPTFIEEGEKDTLTELFLDFCATPAGRHLWVTGVPGRNFVLNCHNSHFNGEFSAHCAFTFDELMKGGGVGTNYSNRYIGRYKGARRPCSVHIVCDPAHNDFAQMDSLGLISPKYSHLWDGSIRVEDSREGWVAALTTILDYMFEGIDPTPDIRESLGNDVVFDLSIVREKNSPIRGFGGKASGPWALAKMLVDVSGYLNGTVDAPQLSSLNVMEVDHLIASCVVAGNVRRCLPAATTIVMRNCTKKIAEIEAGDEVLVGPSTFRKVTAITDTGERPTLLIKTDAGRLTCTPEHRVGVIRGGRVEFKEARNLSVFDRLAFSPFSVEDSPVVIPQFPQDEPQGQGRKLLYSYGQTPLTAESAWFFGVIFGGATIRRNPSKGNHEIAIKFNNDTVGSWRRVRDFIVRAFGYNPGLKKDGRCWRLSFYDKYIERFMADYKVGVETFALPEFVRKGTFDTKRAFLAGIFDVVGAILTDSLSKNILAVICKSQKGLIGCVRELTVSMGIATRHFAYSSWVGKSGLCDSPVKGAMTIGDAIAPYTSLEIPSNFLSADELPEKFQPVSIIKITKGLPTQTFDIEVDDTHYFIANGFLVHNSARMSIKSWEDHDVGEFIECKRATGSHWTTNLSVEINNKFVSQIRRKNTRARKLLRKILTQAVLDGEPGVWNYDLSQIGEVGEVTSTNPCLAGDTLIAVADGRGWVPIETLAKEAVNIKVYSLNDFGLVESFDAVNFRSTGLNPVIKIELDNDKWFRATPNHLFYTSSKTWKATKDLVVGDLLANAENGDLSAHAMAVTAVGGYEVVETFNLTVPAVSNYIVGLPYSGGTDYLISHNCGEIPLEPWEACCLGHINMEKFAGDFEGMKKAARYMVRFLIRATFCDILNDKQRDVMWRNRRVGVGLYGYHGWLVRKGVKFSESHLPIHGIGKMLEELYDVIRQEARDYAFQLRIPEPVKVTCLAPTGSIAKLSGASEGIHPVFSPYYIRRVRLADDSPQIKGFKERGLKMYADKDSANTIIVEFVCKDKLVKDVEELNIDPSIIEGASDIKIEDHLAVQAMFQQCFADNAISYTANQVAPEFLETVKKDGRYCLRVIKGRDSEFEELIDSLVGIFIRKLPMLKGTTMVFEGAYDNPPFERLTREAYEKMSREEIISNAIGECANGACPIR